MPMVQYGSFHLYLWVRNALLHTFRSVDVNLMMKPVGGVPTTTSDSVLWLDVNDVAGGYDIEN